MTFNEIIERVQSAVPNTPPGYILLECNRIQNELCASDGTVPAYTSFTDTSKTAITFGATSTDITDAYTITGIEVLDSDGLHIGDEMPFRIDGVRKRIEFYNEDGENIIAWTTNVATVKIYYRKKATAITPSSTLTGSPDIDSNFHGIFECGILEGLCAKNKDYVGAGYWRNKLRDLRLEYRRFLNKNRDNVNVSYQMSPLEASDE